MDKEYYLHFEDNEVSRLDKDMKVIDSKTYKNAEEANAAFREETAKLDQDEKVRIEFVHYAPEFPPQRIQVLANKASPTPK